ncbi:MAG: UPF0104 family protein [Chloroflexi bacterium]|nr:UPF0104 family protein [Chloroflexota bacterium]
MGLHRDSFRSDRGNPPVAHAQRTRWPECVACGGFAANRHCDVGDAGSPRRCASRRIDCALHRYLRDRVVAPDRSQGRGAVGTPFPPNTPASGGTRHQPSHRLDNRTVRGSGVSGAPYCHRIGAYPTLSESALIFVAGFALTVTPGKTGELLKAYFLSRRTGVDAWRAAPISLAERATDGFAVLVLTGAGLSIMWDTGWAAKTGRPNLDTALKPSPRSTDRCDGGFTDPRHRGWRRDDL